MKEPLKKVYAVIRHLDGGAAYCPYVFENWIHAHFFVEKNKNYGRYEISACQYSPNSVETLDKTTSQFVDELSSSLGPRWLALAGLKKSELSQINLSDLSNDK